ncbi:hypothetical protein EVAR_94389_1 [Eumeta japonica]|uniref:(+)RNA virus helicase C-terminal domain-containing protein n=1 Tax=Eumeta variegata TaxID=151549 RepID=A0A4C1TQ18_EUMVA|nr:hypothetical protein EVAR_94389_1 [Eumeta japonica]
MTSVLVKGFRRPKNCDRLIVDKALVSHFGVIGSATRFTDAKEVLLISDVNQLPFIDGLNLFEMQYSSPSLMATFTKELLYTYRNSMGVACALCEVYSGIYSFMSRVRSLRLKRYNDVNIPKDFPNPLYLTYTQVKEETLITQGLGEGDGTRVLTILKAQGLTSEGSVIVRITARHKLHDNVSHAVVVITRHTVSCVYYTDDGEDAIGTYIKVAARQNKGPQRKNSHSK